MKGIQFTATIACCLAIVSCARLEERAAVQVASASASTEFRVPVRSGLEGSAVVLHSMHWRGGRLHEAWLLFGLDGELLRLDRSRPDLQSTVRVSVTSGRYEVLASGELKLSYGKGPGNIRYVDKEQLHENHRGGWTGTWFLKDDELVLGALIRTAPRTWAYSSTDQFPTGEEEPDRFVLVFDEDPTPESARKGTARVSQAGQENIERLFTGTPRDDGLFLRDATGDGTEYVFPIVNLDHERGFGTKSGYAFGFGSMLLMRYASTDVPNWVPMYLPVGRAFDAFR